ncbi:MAG: protein kinase [Anaerolineales bacterium]|nr:protein kinase [Anaerolineales bacterium]
MATVYRAFDPAFKRDVAIKVLPRELLHDLTFRARFEREAQTIAGLEHAAIVPVHDVGEADGQPYIVMRLMPGGSLADRLVAGPIALVEVARILARLAPALDRAHALGVVHRDLKPGNILFDADGEPYIADFGIARLADDSPALTATGVFGTPAYMSPEQARGERLIDGRSDVYALGAMVYQMLSGRLPYEATTPIGMALRHVTDPAPRLSAVRPDLPASCDTVILCAMAKNPDERLPTAAHLRLAVEAVATGAPLPVWLQAPASSTPPIPYAVPMALVPAPATALATLPPASPAVVAAPVVPAPAVPALAVQAQEPHALGLWRRSPVWARWAGGLVAIGLLVGLGALLATAAARQPQVTTTPVAPTAVAAAASTATLDAVAVAATVTAVLEPYTQERYDTVSRVALAAAADAPADVMLIARAESADQRTRHLRLVALDAATAALRWAGGDLTRAGADSPVLTTADRVVLMDGNTLRAFTRADGTEAWSLPLDAGLLSCSLRACFQLVGDVIVIVTADNVVSGIDIAAGQPRWRIELQATPQAIFDLGPVLAVYDEPQPGQGVYRLITPATGETRDFAPQCAEQGVQVRATARTPLARASADVFYAFLGRSVLCVQSYDVATLGLNWTTVITDEAGEGFSYRGQVGAGALFLPSTTGDGVLRVDAETGAESRLAPATGRLLLPLTVREGHVLVRDTGQKAAEDEALAYLDAATGATAWRYELGERAPLEAPYARSGVLTPGEPVWAWRSDAAGPVVFTLGATVERGLDLQVEQVDWTTGETLTTTTTTVAAPGGEPLVPRLVVWRERVVWWLFDSQFLVRHVVDAAQADDVWPPRP